MKLDKTCTVRDCHTCRDAVRNETTIIDRHGIVHTEDPMLERRLMTNLVRNLKKACDEMGMDDTEWWDKAQLAIKEATAFLKEEEK